MLIKKKELIAASLVVLIGAAGYLNWSYQDTISVKDGESYIETGKKLGEAEYVSSDEVVEEETAQSPVPTADTSDGAENAAGESISEEGASEETASYDSADVETVEDTSGNYFAEAKLNKDEARSKALEILNQTAANEGFDEEVRQKAGDKIIAEAENAEKETAIESLAQSKGYDEVFVYIDNSTANVAVRKADFSDNDVTVLAELVTSQTDLSANDVKVIEVK